MFTTKLTDWLFRVESDMMDFEYFVELPNARDTDKAIEITEDVLSKYAEADEDEMYYYMGFVEVVQFALEKAEIEADFFVKLEEEE